MPVIVWPTARVPDVQVVTFRELAVITPVTTADDAPVASVSVGPMAVISADRTFTVIDAAVIAEVASVSSS